MTGDHAAADGEIVTVRPEHGLMTLQKLPYFVGISSDTAGASGLSLNLVMIPPGGAAEPHFHAGFETAIYVLKGQIETQYGLGLQKSVIHHAGDFLYIPANLPHRPVNLSATEAAFAIVARSDPNERENVIPYDGGGAV